MSSTNEEWKRKYVVIRRPYVCLYDHESDPVVRKLINLASAKASSSDDQAQILQRRNVFSLYTRKGGFLFQGDSPSNVQEWLYAIDPLAAGMIRSRSGTIRMKAPGAPAAF